MEKLGRGCIVYGDDVESLVFDWGTLKFLSEPEVTGAARFSFGMVVLAPGKGHESHNHHSTINTGWEPLRLLVIYAPPGSERGLRDIPGCEVLPPGEVPQS